MCPFGERQNKKNSEWQKRKNCSNGTHSKIIEWWAKPSANDEHKIIKKVRTLMLRSDFTRTASSDYRNSFSCTVTNSKMWRHVFLLLSRDVKIAHWEKDRNRNNEMQTETTSDLYMRRKHLRVNGKMVATQDKVSEWCVNEECIIE